MSLVPSLLQAIVRVDGEALVMHAGDKPYVVSPTGQVELANRGLTLEAVNGIVGQLLPRELQAALDEFGAVQYELPAMPQFPGEYFTVVAARGGDDVWTEIRRRRLSDDDRVPEEFFGPSASPPAARAPLVAPPPPRVSAVPPPIAAQPVAPQAVRSSRPVGKVPAAPRAPIPPPVVTAAAHLAAPPVAAAPPVVAAPVVAAPPPVAAAPAMEIVAKREQVMEIVEDDDLQVPGKKQLWPGERFADADGEEEEIDLDAELDEEEEQEPEAPAPVTEVRHAPIAVERPIESVTPLVAAAPPLPVVPSSPSPIALAPPLAVAAEPPVAIADEPNVMAEPPAMITDAAAVMPEPPVMIADAPAVTPEPPVMIADAPAVTPEPPVMSTDAPAMMPEPPVMIADAPAAMAEPPVMIADAPAAMAEAPVMIADAPVAMAEPPAMIADAPAAIAEPPPMIAEEPAVMPEPVAPAATTRPAPTPPPAPRAVPLHPGVVLPIVRTPIRSEHPPAPVSDQTLSALERLLRVAAARGASTLYLSSGSRPSVRVDGELQMLDGEPVHVARDVEALLLTLMPERSHEALRTGAATEWICEIEGVGRVRCMSFRDHLGPGGVFRMMPMRSVSAEQLALPHQVQALAIEPEGLVLVAGSRSSGKRTLMAAFVDLMNRTRRDHIITIESEINIVHERGHSLISQREVRGNEDDMLSAARAALREDPDVLFIEDLRTGPLMNVALEAAASGRLVVGGFSAHTAAGAIDRIIDLYAPEYRRQVQLALADSLRGVIVQALLRKIGGGRLAAREVLLNTAAVSSVIAEGKTSQLPMAIEGGRRYGMMPLNDALVGLVQNGSVEAREAYRHSPDRPGFLAALNRNGIDTSFVERLA